MATMNISLPKQMKAWVEAQSVDGRYSNSSDYVRDLIRKDQEREAKIAHMRKLVQEGLDSGISNRTIDEIYEAAKAKYLSQEASK